MRAFVVLRVRVSCPNYILRRRSPKCVSLPRSAQGHLNGVPRQGQPKGINKNLNELHMPSMAMLIFVMIIID